MGRLLHAISFGTVKAARGRDRIDPRNGLRERELQFQVPISGTAANGLAFTPITIAFDYAFYFAPAQRESNLEYPHFTYGSQTNPAVGVHCSVSEWLMDESNGGIVGAVVQIGAVIGEGEVPFTGTAHLTFQGFAALVEEDQAPIVSAG